MLAWRSILEILCRDADFHRAMAVDGTVQNRGVGPVDRVVLIGS
jgi:hypothetical protein